MTCREIDAILAGGELTAEAREHLASCADCRALAEAFGGGAPYPVDRAAVSRLLDGMKPVRPMAAPGAFASLFLLIAGGLAALVGTMKGVFGLPSMTGTQAAVIFGLLLALLLGVSFVVAQDMRPGARTVRGLVVALVAVGVMEAVFLTLFHNYDAGRFLQSGIRCFGLGGACAAATGVVSWLVLRRGYVVSPVSTGASVGALAGLAGLAALELHCPILTIPHLVVWHGGVLAASTAVGALVGKVARGK